MNKLLVSSRFLYGTVGKYRYPVAEFAGGQAVGDIDGGLIACDLIKLTVDLRLGDGERYRPLFFREPGR